MCSKDNSLPFIGLIWKLNQPFQMDWSLVLCVSHGNQYFHGNDKQKIENLVKQELLLRKNALREKELLQPYPQLLFSPPC